MIEERGWTQERFEDKNGAVCASRALEIAKYRAPMSHQTAWEALKPKQFFSLSEWNDVPGRTKEEVLRHFEETAARLEAVA